MLRDCSVSESSTIPVMLCLSVVSKVCIVLEWMIICDDWVLLDFCNSWLVCRKCGSESLFT